MGSIVNLLGSGIEFGCSFTYKVQEKPEGIAHALSLAEGFVGKDKFVVILGDNVTTGSLKSFVSKFEKQNKGAKILLQKVNDPTRYGIASIDEQQVLDIEEKPKQPKSNFAVLGYYMYDSKVFDIIRGIKPSARGEYEITSVNNEYIKLGQLTYDFLEADWTDAGTFESLLFANKLFLKDGHPSQDKINVSEEQLKDMIGSFEEKIKELKKYFG
jgi:glucose-1-phosphate thymidylyltransferase